MGYENPQYISENILLYVTEVIKCFKYVIPFCVTKGIKCYTLFKQV